MILDSGTQSILAAFASPAMMVAAFAYMMNRYIDKQERRLDECESRQGKLETTIAVLSTDRSAIIVEEHRKELSALREEHTKTRSSIEAAWRVIDNKRSS